MDVLPRFIEVLDSSGRHFEPRRRLQRVAAGARSEAEWDRIISENVELLADALREAQMIAEDSTLMFLGAQIDNVDLVFAEVRQDPGQELRRLVLLEDKLLRNPEARRQVLAQILDYAKTAQDEWPRANFVEKFRERGEWAAEYEEELRRTCRRGDFLLVIAGDGIDDRLAKLAHRFAGRDDPLSLTEFALVSMALYALEDNLLLVPHVVNAVQRSEREITLKVVVQDVHGREVTAEVTRDVQDESEQALARRLPVRDEVSDFLLKARGVLADRLHAEHPDLTPCAKPRKSLDYWMTGVPSTLFKIHFGGYQKEVWAPIQVGVMIGTADRSGRDAWRKKLDPLLGTLPPNTSLSDGGPRTLNVLTSFDWSDSSDLNDDLLKSVTNALYAFVTFLAPQLRAPGPGGGPLR